MGNSVYIIAEAGVNHNGDIKLAYKLVDAAKEAGVSCVKFQTYITENDTVRNCEKADYQKKSDDLENQFDMVKRLELSFDEYMELKKYCDEQDIVFLSSPFDLDSLAFLNNIEMPFWKIASSEITNYPFLRNIGMTQKPVVMSTGMCTLAEIDEALAVLKKFGTEKIMLLHCNTEYPTPMIDVNLKAMLSLRDKYNVEVGYSDHTLGTEVCVAAVAMGATVIEKHFTLDNDMEGPDHKASLNPVQLKQLVEQVRNIEVAMGSAEKKPSMSELNNKVAARKSLVANTKIKKGDILGEKNLAAKRPGGGVSPMRWEEYIGRVSNRDYEEDEMIDDV